jgi:hypothetical protein
MADNSEYNQRVNAYYTPNQPFITAEEVLTEIELRCSSGQQYTTFPNQITDEEKALIEAKNYIVTRNYIDSENRDGAEPEKLYIGFQVALTEDAIENAMVISQAETNGVGEGGGGGGGSTLIEKSITENGVYNASDDSADGYSKVTVDVSTDGHTVVLTTIPNAEVTLTSVDNTYTGTADNTGELQLNGVAVGTYTVSATYDGAASDSTTITIQDHMVTEDSFASLTISASANTSITVTDGTVTKTLEYTGTPIVQYVSLGTWDLSCTIDDTVITCSVLVGSYTNQNVVLAPPSAAIQRYVDFTTNTTTLTGDPSTHPVYAGMTRCNVADNGTINAYYGDAGYTEDGSNGQIMVKVPKFYYKFTPITLDGANIREGQWEISDVPADGFSLHPAFLAADGVTELDYFMYGAFDAVGQDSNGDYSTSYNTTTYKLGSVGGNTYVPTDTLTRATARTMATNRGTGWYSAGVKQTMAIQMLFGVEYGFNSQLAVGWGVVSDSAAHKTGTTGNTTSGTRDNKTTIVNYRGIENLWGNIWNWIDGLNCNNRTPYVCNTFTFVDDTSTGYTQIAFNLPTTNYITAFGYDANNSWILLPSESSSTANVDGPIGDYVTSDSGWRVSRLGALWSSDSYAGAFYWACSNHSSDVISGIGARLMYIPQTT